MDFLAGHYWTWRKDGVHYKNDLNKPFDTYDECGNFYSRSQVKKLMGKGLDIHKMIGKIPNPKSGWTPGNYKFMGPYNPLQDQLKYDPKTGEVLEWKIKPYNKVYEIANHHDICYDMGKNKGDCDRQMVQSLDQIPYGEMPKWGQRDF